jgi:hypothetical protein
VYNRAPALGKHRNEAGFCLDLCQARPPDLSLKRKNRERGEGWMKRNRED